MKCGNCGATFDPADILYRREDYGEKIACCPVCGVSDLIETEECKLCGKEFEEDDLCEGFCLECLWEAIDYDVALEYLKWRELLADFMIGDIFGAKLEYTSFEMNLFLEETFRRYAADEKLRTAWKHSAIEPEFLIGCRNFILPYHYKGSIGIEGQYFAEWYADRLKQAKQEQRS